MEFASYLAGERWSDHPSCTDPVLASLARGVNDNLSDARRDEIAIEIPRVIGLRGDDSVVGLVVALRAAIAALPVASMERQRSLAIGILALRPALADRGVETRAARPDSPIARSPMFRMLRPGRRTTSPPRRRGPAICTARPPRRSRGSRRPASRPPASTTPTRC